MHALSFLIPLLLAPLCSAASSGGGVPTLPWVRAVQIVPRGGQFAVQVVLSNRSALSPDTNVEVVVSDVSTNQVILSYSGQPLDLDVDGVALMQAGLLTQIPADVVSARARATAGPNSRRDFQYFDISTADAAPLSGLMWVAAPSNGGVQTYTLQPFPSTWSPPDATWSCECGGVVTQSGAPWSARSVPASQTTDCTVRVSMSQDGYVVSDPISVQGGQGSTVQSSQSPGSTQNSGVTINARAKAMLIVNAIFAIFASM